ncbi:hypothetical protein E2562_006936 [Oryza meyeriana var. granulata]|uniref:Uncharacterized protein n=1 Tax=Oryza meyeriana var. granulata TaxID=110450 RepID=A0A6G1EA91_9ORYZ|nr:hypothetical protein E2562_006936 [Oryza meyeriana var. granulata]
MARSSDVTWHCGASVITGLRIYQGEDEEVEEMVTGWVEDSITCALLDFGWGDRARGRKRDSRRWSGRRVPWVLTKGSAC